jgi:CheY-like chemotaxis protein
LHVAVRDTGIGIPSNKINTLFQSFTQVDASTTRRFGGTGLGLAISKRLVNLMGGQIWVTSELGEGSVFQFVVPYQPVPAQQIPVAADSGFPGASSGRAAGNGRIINSGFAAQVPLRILLAEDNPVNQRVAVRLLERLGYQPDAVSDGLEVLQALARQTYDIILMDVQMPEMDGLEATRQIRAQWTREEQPWICALTAGAMKENRDECLAAGVDDFLSKPINVKELERSLARCHRELNRRTDQASEPALAPDAHLIGV